MPRGQPLHSQTCTARLERQAQREGWRLVAGCDEVGRGAWLGPLVAAAVILDPSRPIAGLDDSKKLHHEERERLAVEIRQCAIAYGIATVKASAVDALNVYQASRQAMIEALAALLPSPDFVLTDAMPLLGFPIPHRAIIHGDARSVSIAAASILAKVERDGLMQELDRIYPHYQAGKNKGYGTREHLEGLERYGPCPEHRRSFKPVQEALWPRLPFDA